ncbi:MAG TPA: hypothetical protein VH413_19655 [Verrucomicrobiae bacterium]|jgi:sugar lactone lactonase YvrE|nr:hypothetical protein [Verrucomicrobiae bacterium]
MMASWFSIFSRGGRFAGLFFLAGFLAQSAMAQSGNSSAYTWTTFAGTSGIGNADGVGQRAQFDQPAGVVVDSNGTVFVADMNNDTIRKITAAGLVTTIAGFSGTTGNADGINNNARFLKPSAIAVDRSGNLFVADRINFEIRELQPVGTNWVVSTVAGFARFNPDGDPLGGNMDGIGTNATFDTPSGIAIDAAGNLYVADTGNSAIRKITLVGTNWVVSTLPGSVANLNEPIGIAVDASSNLYVADFDAGTAIKVTPQGSSWRYTTIAGGGADSPFFGPSGIAVDNDGNVYVTDSENCIVVKLTPSGQNYTVDTFAGQTEFDGDGEQIFGNSDGTGTNALFNSPQGITVDSSGNLYVADTGNNEVRKITSAAVVTTLAGLAASAGNVDGVGQDARFSFPTDVAIDNAGNFYVTDSGNETIRKISSEAEVTTLAGSVSNMGSANGAGNNAQFNTPYGIAVDDAGNLYIADQGSHTIRKVTAAGVVTTIAGLAGHSGSANGSNSVARFNVPSALALDANTNIYVCDSENFTIRKMTLNGTNWAVTTFAGKSGTPGGTDATGTSARFGFPYGIAIDAATNLYVADRDNFAIRRVTAKAVVSTIAGGNEGTADGLGTDAQFYSPAGVAVDGSTNIYVADNYSSTIRKLTPVGSQWEVSTIGGQLSTVLNQFDSPVGGSADGAGTMALFYNPQGIAVDGAGDLYVADFFNNTIRKGQFTAYSPVNTTVVTPGMGGALMVTLLPSEAHGQWRFPWEIAWHDSGFTATNLAGGNYPVEFREVPGWLAIPPRLTTSNFVVVAASGVTQLTNSYFPTSAPSEADSADGSLTISLGANPPAGAGWRFLGDTTPFFASNFTTNLVVGTYLIEFAGPFANRATPENESVQVLAGQPTVISVSYPFAAPPPGNTLLPTPVPVANIADATNFPFAFDGQLQTDVGFGSGVVVQTNVVLTAAHLLFDDETQSYASGAYFFLQKELPTYVPSAEIARGWYLLSGYATQRTNDLNSGLFGPDVSSPDSRNLDVAAIYFQTAVAGGGFGGYLPSDAVPNQWLSGNSEKMLVGYPVDGSQYGVANIVPGMMYQAGPQPYPLNLASDTTAAQQEVYTASWFLSYPGNSGGPFYVELNGYFYPAGVYLGTLNGQSVVRAIDSNVTNLITLAATLGDAGTNFNGGGVITVVPNQSVSFANPGYLQVELGPPAAVAAGAAWLLQPHTNYSTVTNFTEAVFSTNAVVIAFKPIPGWIVPTNQSITVTPGIISASSISYTVANPMLVITPQGIGLRGTTNTIYRIESTASLQNPNWVGLSTNTITSSGVNVVLPLPVNPVGMFYRAVWLGR